MKKIKIGIEINDNKYKNKDFTHLLDGNPGIGGIQYQLLLLGDCLSNFFDDKYEIVYFHYSPLNDFPEGIKEVICEDDLDILRVSLLEDIDELIVNCNKSDLWYESLRKTNLNVLVRAGCYLDIREIYNIRLTKQIVRIITISSEEYDYYIDDDIIDRTICIENMMSFLNNNYPSKKALLEMKFKNGDTLTHNVAYIGSLVPQKGFARLARIWPQIINKIPDAHLYVIGSGQLYGSDNELGKYGIAEEVYENKFMKYLTDKNGNIIQSVTFCGLIEDGYADVLNNISVGVVNPIALTETFCTSAIDFSSYCIPVVTCGKHGLLSTVLDNITGLTFHTDIGFKRNIISLLTNATLNKKLSINAYDFSRTFDCQKIVKKWDKALQDLYEEKKCTIHKVEGNYLNDFKILKLVNAFFRRKMGLKFIPSSVDYKKHLMDIAHFSMRIIRKILGISTR